MVYGVSGGVYLVRIGGLACTMVVSSTRVLLLEVTRMLNHLLHGMSVVVRGHVRSCTCYHGHLCTHPQIGCIWGVHRLYGHAL